MVIWNRIELRQVAGRHWKRPETGLRELQQAKLIAEIVPEIGGSRSWRKKPFKKYWEEYQAALFSYGLQQQSKSFLWEYSYGESSDYDCVLRCHLSPEDGGLVYKPVQLKELVPAGLPHSQQYTIQRLLDDAARKYTAKPDEEMLVLAIFINRATTINFREIKIPKSRVQQLWIFGFLDESNCFLVGGNPNGKAAKFSFGYPHFFAE